MEVDMMKDVFFPRGMTERGAVPEDPVPTSFNLNHLVHTTVSLLYLISISTPSHRSDTLGPLLSQSQKP